MDDDSQPGAHPWEPPSQEPSASDWPHPSIGSGPSYPYSVVGAPDPASNVYPPAYPGVQSTQWGSPAPPSGYGAAYPGAPYYAPPGYPVQPAPPYSGAHYAAAPRVAAPPAPGWSPYGYPPPYPTWQGMPFALPSAPAKRKRLPMLAIVGMVALMIVVAIAGSAGVLVALGPLPANGPFGQKAHATTGPEPTPMTYDYDLKDSLNGAINVGWAVNARCYFKDGAYHVNPGPSSPSHACSLPMEATYYDFDARVTVSQVAGPQNYGYGLIFRLYNGVGYLFSIDSSGHAWVDSLNSAKTSRLSPVWSPPNFATGLNASNTIRIIAQGSTFTFCVNGEQIGQMTDSASAYGSIWLFSGDYNLDAAFTNLELHGNT